MLIYTKIESPRIHYVLDLIFNNLLGFDVVKIVHSKTKFEQDLQPYKFSYGEYIDKQTPFLAQGTALLAEHGIQNEQPEFVGKGEQAFCYPTKDKRSLLDFDLFAMAFYLVSRYEEYLDFEEDGHGRFAAVLSTAHRAAFLDFPLIDIWAHRLRDQLASYYPALPELPQYSFQPSYDIDFAWAYQHKAAWRQWAASLRDLLKGQFANIRLRRAVLNGHKADPFDTFAYLDQLHQQHSNLKPLYFMLLGKYGKYDKNIRPNHPAMLQLVENLNKKYPLGIHPSYGSNQNKEQLVKEITHLRQQTGSVTQSRQHFVMLHFPETYRNLIQLGIEADYSMGYASRPGFRASTARPFYWYDLAAEQKTALKVHPFMLMDVTFKRYMGLSPQAAIECMQPIIERSKAAGGALMSIWHNNSLCECEGWEGWRAVYEALLEMVI